MEIPTRVLEAAGDPGGGRLVIVMGAGCSIEEPTCLPSSKQCSRDVWQKLVDDGVLLASDCVNPDDLSCLADAVYAKCGSQAELVRRLPPEFHFAEPNEGSLLAAAMLREGVAHHIVTLNIDLSMSSALVDVGTDAGIRVLRRPEDHGQMGARNLVYIHRNVETDDPDTLVLRTEALEEQWKAGWEEVIAKIALSVPVVIFAGLGTEVGVLVASAEHMKEVLADKVTLVQVDIGSRESSVYAAKLDIDEDHFVSAPWSEFMRRLGERVSLAQSRALQEAVSHLIAQQDISSEDVMPLLERLDEALELLATEGRRDDRRLVEAKAAQADLSADRKDVEHEPAEALIGVVTEARAAAASPAAALENARQVEAERREQAVRSQERTAQLAALAQLALQHLGDRCPVCTQKHDRETTIAHLRKLMDETGSLDVQPKTAPDIDALSAQNVERERALREVEAEYERRRAREQAQEVANAQRTQRLAALGIENESSAEQELDDLISGIGQRLRSMSLLREQGETLALSLARSGEVARRAELGKERDALARSVASASHEVATRRETSKLVDQMFDALRDAAVGLVDSQLDQIKPLVERIYARIDPHPAFRKVELSSRFESSRGRLRATVTDPLTNVSVDRPGTVLSSSQLNALAVSVFLALNLGVPRPPLSAVLLDDPLQSLDDVNLLGLVDLLRRTKQRRQLIISTHEMRFAALLERKLRPAADTRTVVVELSGWRREGPHVEQRNIAPESQRLRLVA